MKFVFGIIGFGIFYYILFVGRIIPFLVYALICAIPYGIWRFVRYVARGCPDEDSSELPGKRIEPHL